MNVYESIISPGLSCAMKLWTVSGLVCVFVLLGCACAQALDTKDVSLYLTFDNTLGASVSDGDVSPKASIPSIAFAPGISGSAVILGQPGAPPLNYAVRNILSERQGTIAFWAKPQWKNWGKLRHFVTIPNRLTYWYSHNYMMAFTTEKWQLAEYPNPLENNDKWHHIAMTWGNGECSLYGDGRLFIHKTGLPVDLTSWDSEDGEFTVGPLNPGDDDSVLLDELMVFNRPLAPVEVKNIYRHGAVKLAQPSVRINEIDPAKGLYASGLTSDTAQLSDFVEYPFGNLTEKPVSARLAYDADNLYIEVGKPKGADSDKKSTLEVAVLPKPDAVPTRVVVSADGSYVSYSGTSQTNLDGCKVSSSAANCIMILPWKSLGVTASVGTTFGLNIIQRWSREYGDWVSWADIKPAGEDVVSERYGKVTLGGNKPVLALKKLGQPGYGLLDLSGDIINPAGTNLEMSVQASLRPSDFREIYDAALGLRTYSGTQISLDSKVAVSGPRSLLKMSRSFSDMDINSLLFKLTDDLGETVYEAQRPFITMPRVVSAVKLYPKADRVEVSADISNYSDIPLVKQSAVIELYNTGGKLLDKKTVASFSKPEAKVAFRLDPLPVGKIAVRTRLVCAGKDIAQFDTEFEKIEIGPWRDNKLGKDDIVIPPFTPVKVDGQSVSVWGRIYRWSDSLFPVQVISGGEELLAGPIELLCGASATGKSNPATVKITAHTDTRAIVQCESTIGDVAVTASHLIEYDGMCLTTLKVAAEGSGTGSLAGLSLYIPYKDKQTTLYNRIGAGGSINKILTDGKAEMGLWSSLWLGNEDRGIAWFCTNNNGWRSGGEIQTETMAFNESCGAEIGSGMKNSAQCIQREANCVSLTVRFADQPFEFTEDQNYTFGIIATPVRENMHNWRFFRNMRDFGYCWFGGFTKSNNDIANIEPGWKKALADTYAGKSPYYDRPIPILVPYQRPDWINTRQKECEYFREEWQVSPPEPLMGSDDGSDNRHMVVCMGSEWQDFELYYLMKAYDENNMTGFYFDAGRNRCSNPEHKHSREYDALAYREFLKRLAVECSKRGRPYLIWVHASANIEMPALSFANMIWNGEQYSTVGGTESYDTIIPLDLFRAQFLGQQFGMPVQLLSYLRGSAPPAGKQNPTPEEVDAQKKLDAYIGLLLVHGVPDLSCTSLSKPNRQHLIRTVLDPQEKFGVMESDAKFLPYWKNADAITVLPADENLVCSAWQRPGKLLLLLGNSTKADQTAKIKLNLAALGLKGKLEAVDTRTSKKLSITDGSMVSTVESANWRMIEVSIVK